MTSSPRSIRPEGSSSDLDSQLRSSYIHPAPQAGVSPRDLIVPLTPPRSSQSAAGYRPRHGMVPYVQQKTPEELYDIYEHQWRKSLDVVGLDSLADGPPKQKPPYPYPVLIRCAILGSPKKSLTLSEIYLTISARYPWFNDDKIGSSWKVCFLFLHSFPMPWEHRSQSFPSAFTPLPSSKPIYRIVSDTTSPSMPLSSKFPAQSHGQAKVRSGSSIPTLRPLGSTNGKERGARRQRLKSRSRILPMNTMGRTIRMGA
jgi:hypothetical protein